MKRASAREDVFSLRLKARRRDVEAGEDMKGGYIAKVSCAFFLVFFFGIAKDGRQETKL